MISSDHRHGARDCPRCGRFIDLDRTGRYRRHFALESAGRKQLCTASGQAPEGVVQLLTVEPTPQECYSHALRLLRLAG